MCHIPLFRSTPLGPVVWCKEEKIRKPVNKPASAVKKVHSSTLGYFHSKEKENINTCVVAWAFAFGSDKWGKKSEDFLLKVVQSGLHPAQKWRRASSCLPIKETSLLVNVGKSQEIDSLVS